MIVLQKRHLFFVRHMFHILSLLTLYWTTEVVNHGTMRSTLSLLCCSTTWICLINTNCPFFVFHFCHLWHSLLNLVPLSLLSITSLSRMCVSECPSGFFRDDRKRCKKCSSLCETCVGSRSDQCTTCRAGFHLNEGSNTCVANCADSFYLDHGTFHCWPNCLHNAKALH